MYCLHRALYQAHYDTFLYVMLCHVWEMKKRPRVVWPNHVADLRPPTSYSNSGKGSLMATLTFDLCPNRIKSNQGGYTDIGGGDYGANGDYGGGEFDEGDFMDQQPQQDNGEMAPNGFDTGVGFQPDHMVRSRLTGSRERAQCRARRWQHSAPETP